MFSIVVPPIIVIFLIGVFFKRGNGYGSIMTLTLGTLFGVTLFVLEQFDLWHVHYTINVGIMILFSTLVFVIASYQRPAPELSRIENLTYDNSLLGEGMEGLPWYKDYRTHAFFLVLLILWILITFW